MSTDVPPGENTYVIDAEDAAEMARLVKQDRLLTEGMGGVFPENAHLSGVNDILDIGCGPGGWVLDVAFEYAKVNVVGIDISEQMVEYARAHAEVQGMNNASFQVMNALESLAFDDNSFDVVNARYIQAFMMKTSWAPLMKEIMRILRPGGRVLLTDGEWSISNSPAFEKMGAMLTHVGTVTGRSFSPDGRHVGVTPMLGRFLRDAGYQHIQQKAHVLDCSMGMEPYGSFYQDFMIGLKLLQPFMIKMGVTSEEEFEDQY